MRHVVTTSPPATRLALCFISVLPFILFWRWLLRGDVLYWGTLLLQFWPWHHLVKESWLAGEWPLWSPLLGNGAPLLANLQSAVFYPPNLLFLLIPTEHALTSSILLHLLLGGLFMFFYTRRLAFRPFGATVSALAFMFSGYLVGRTQFIVMVHAAAWYPLLLLVADRLAIRRQWPDAIWLAIVLALQFFAGHAQLWFYGVWLVGAYVLFRALPRVALPVVLVTAAVTVSLLLAAVQILPTMEYVAQSPRQTGAERYFALTYSMWPWRLITLVAPDFFGNPTQANYWGYANYWEDHAYLGVLPFIFALTAIWYWFKSRRWRTPLDPRLRVVPFFAVLAPISIILALGWNTPIYLWIFDYVPGFSFFQGPARLLIWYTVAMAVLAGAGAELIIITDSNRPNWRRFLAACVAVTFAGTAGEWLLSGRDLTFLTPTRNLGLLLLAAVILLLIQPDRVKAKPMRTEEVVQKQLHALSSPDTPKNAELFLDKALVWQIGVVIFIAIDLLLAAWPLLPMTSSTVFQGSSTSANVLKAQTPGYRFLTDQRFAYAITFDEYFRFHAFGPSNPAHLQSFRETLAANLGVPAGLSSANNNDPLRVERQQRLIDRLESASPELQMKLLALMNVGYRIGLPSERAWPILYRSDQFVIQQVPHPLPRAYFIAKARVVEDPAAALERLLASDFDPRHEVVIIDSYIDSQVAPAAGPGTVENTPVEIEEKSSGALRLQLDAPSAGFVVLTDTFYPGWQATVNGIQTPILPANVAFRAVPVTAGTQEINFEFRPQTFTFGLWTSIVAWLIMLGTLLRLTRQQ